MPQVQERPLQAIPAQTTQETARQIAQARLEFDPQLAAQQFQLLQQYYQPTAQLQFQTQQQLAPQAAQLEYETARQYTPLYRAIYEQAFPEQTAGLRELAAQSLQRFQAPDYLTPEQRGVQERGYEFGRQQIRRNVREAANLGGTLYSGSRIQAEQDALNRFEEAILAQDLERQRLNRAQSLQELIAAQQVVFPQIQQPGVPGGYVPQYQTAAPSPDALLQAALGQQGNAIINPAVVGFGPSARELNMRLAGQLAQAGGTVGGAAIMACHVAEVLYGLDDPRTWLARFYVATNDGIFLRVYRKYSRKWALWLNHNPQFKPIIKPIWDRMVRLGLLQIFGVVKARSIGHPNL